MKVLAIFPLLLVVSLTSGFNLQGKGNDNLKEEAVFYPRIANGQDAKLNQFPYQVGLSVERNWLTGWSCGGSLIANEWVLTAAHCIYRIYSVTVQLGMLTNSKPAAVCTVGKRKVFPHYRYKGTPGRADIGLIKVPYVKYTDAIQPIALPRKFQHYFNTTAIVSGWGLTSDKDDPALTLKYTTVQIISNKECEKYYGPGIINSGKICTGHTHYETCKGDSGGPMISNVTGKLIGITSLGNDAGCGHGFPLAFIRVDYFLKWIRRKTGLQL